MQLMANDAMHRSKLDSFDFFANSSSYIWDSLKIIKPIAFLHGMCNV